jgi:hypothetical protein
MTKQLILFFTQKDEEVFSNLLKQQFPQTAFIDGVTWPSPKPPLKSSISECDSRIVAIWNTEAMPSFLGAVDVHGRFNGPQSGFALQFMRSEIKENLLIDGRIAAGLNSPSSYGGKMSPYILGVWKLVKGMTHKINAIDPTTDEISETSIPMFRAGPDACEWCRADKRRYFKYHTVFGWFRPAS